MDVRSKLCFENWRAYDSVSLFAMSLMYSELIKFDFGLSASNFSIICNLSLWFFLNL